MIDILVNLMNRKKQKLLLMPYLRSHKMNVYNINGTYQQHCVVADSYKEAEKAYKNKYPFVTIESIKLHSVYVEIQTKVMNKDLISKQAFI